MRTWIRSLIGALVVVAVLLTISRSPTKTSAEDQEKKMTTCAALGEELRAAEATMPVNARELISLLILEERHKPDEFSESWRWRLDNCGTWFVNAEHLSDIAYNSLPICGTDIAEDNPLVVRFHVLTERIKYYGGLVALTLPLLFERPTEKTWMKWTMKVWDAQAEAPPKDITAPWLPKSK